MTYFASIRENGRFRTVLFHAENLAAALLISRALGAVSVGRFQ